jgi:hypothetical protein
MVRRLDLYVKANYLKLTFAGIKELRDEGTYLMNKYGIMRNPSGYVLR